MYIICKHNIYILYIYIYIIYINKDTVGKRYVKYIKTIESHEKKPAELTPDNLVYFFLSSTCTIFI